MLLNNLTTTVGFGTAALGGNCYDVTLMALENGFRAFDTAEADYWYDQSAVGKALHDYFLLPELQQQPNDDDETCRNVAVVDHNKAVDDDDQKSSSAICTRKTCVTQDLRISTKIPPWSLFSIDNIRSNAAASRQDLVGFCDDNIMNDEPTTTTDKFPLEVYYIHAPTCWPGWHTRCDHHPPLLDLRTAWRGMEAVVSDGNARRIGLSNVSPDELRDIISFVRERQERGGGGGGDDTDPNGGAPPRMPDAVQAHADPIYPAEELRAICREHGIEFVSYSTLGTQHRSVQTNPVLGSPIVQKLAHKHSRSTAEVVLSWALHGGMSIIPRSGNKEHIQNLARLFKEDPLFLDQGDLAEIDAMKYTL